MIEENNLLTYPFLIGHSKPALISSIKWFILGANYQIQILKDFIRYFPTLQYILTVSPAGALYNQPLNNHKWYFFIA